MSMNKDQRDAFANKAKGKFDPTAPYEDTMSYSETMRARGYEYVDGRWQ